MKIKVGKVCTNCKIEKTPEEFGNCSQSKNGKKSRCLACASLGNKKYMANYYIENSAKIKNRTKNWRLNNVERKKFTDHIRYASRAAEFKQKSFENYKKTKSNRRSYLKNLRATSAVANIEHKVRNRIRMALKRNFTKEAKKAERSITLLGCTSAFYKEYITQKFTEGMTWNLYLKGEIHIDHIIPLCSFDLTIPIEQFKAFHYSNTQPLWKTDNLQKNAQDRKQSIRNKKAFNNPR